MVGNSGLFQLLLLVAAMGMMNAFTAKARYPARSLFLGSGSRRIIHRTQGDMETPVLRSSHAMTMRDISASYWFRVGDSVRVIADVYKADTNLKGRVGTVRETWEKCDVDPTCCCAEQVDTNMAIRVSLEGDGSKPPMEYHFAEAELVKVDTRDKTH